MKKKGKTSLGKRVKIFFAKRQHPIIILSYTTKYLWLLIIPLAKYLIATRFNFQSWIKANWVDILTLSVIFGYAFFRWFFVYFEVKDDLIVAHTGYFGITETRVYFSQISTVTLSQGYVSRAINACTVYVDTDAKSIQSSDIKLYLPEKTALEIYELAKKKCIDKPKFIYNSSKSNLLVFSLLFSSTLSGVVIVLTLMYEAYNIVGRETEQFIIMRVNSQLEKLPLIEHIPRYFLIAGGVIAGGWIVSFTANLMRHWNFSCTRCGEMLLVKSGIGTRRRHALVMDKINYVDYQQSLLMKFFRICSVSVNCTGYGKRRLEISALIPITTNSRVDSSMKMLIPGIVPLKADVKTGKADILRFITIPVICCFVSPATAWVLMYFFPDWTREIKALAIISVIPLLWLCAVKFVASFTTSIGFDGDDCTFSYCNMYRYHKTIVNKKRISKISVSQNPFQKVSGTCCVRIYTNSESTKRHSIKGLNYKKVISLLEKSGYKF